MSSLTFVITLQTESEDNYQIHLSEVRPSIGDQFKNDGVIIELYKNGKVIATTTEPRMNIQRLGEVLGGRNY